MTSTCHTCREALTLQQARLHMWDHPEHDVELDPDAERADQLAFESAHVSTYV